MRLDLVQHAKAAAKEVDPGRPLTEQGRADIRKVADLLAPLNISVDYLWHSGKTRAAQTAQVLFDVVKVSRKFTAHDGLSPNDNVEDIADEITSAGVDVMIVGHMPFVAKLATLLLTGDESADLVAFQQGAILCLRTAAPNHWQIEWMITPEVVAE